MARPLLGRRPKRKPRPPHKCMACPAMIPAWQWLCDPCFGAVSYSSKHAICEARAAREPHRVYGLSFEAAKTLIAKREQEAERN
jgi:hypothetical protein